GNLFIAVRAVETDGGGVDERLRFAARGAWLAAEGLHHVRRAVCTTFAEQCLEAVAPAAGEDVFAGEVDDGVTGADFVLPGAGVHGIAFDQRDVCAELLPG